MFRCFSSSAQTGYCFGAIVRTILFRSVSSEFSVFMVVQYNFNMSHSLSMMMKGVGQGWQDKFTEFMIGKIVLTRYNNACYKIDDIWWDSNPTDSFLKRGNEVIDYICKLSLFVVSLLIF